MQGTLTLQQGSQYYVAGTVQVYGVLLYDIGSETGVINAGTRNNLQWIWGNKWFLII